MSDLKSKIPDINEITSMAGKLFKDVKNSITEIISDYKQKHPESPPVTSEPVAATPPKETTAEQTIVEPPPPTMEIEPQAPVAPAETQQEVIEQEAIEEPDLLLNIEKEKKKKPLIDE